MVGAAWFLEQLQKNNYEGNYLIAAPTVKILHQSTLAKFFELLAPVGGVKRIGTYRKALSEIELKGKKGFIYIRSCEDPELIEGMTISGAVWLDEGGQVVERAWINIVGRTSIAEAPILITTTPYFLNWVYRDIFMGFKRGDPQFNVIMWRSIDSPYFPKTEFENRRRTMSEAEFGRRYMGEWRQAANLIFADFYSERHVIQPRPIDYKEEEVFCGVDFGFNPNPTVFLWMSKNKDGVYTVFDEYIKTNRTAYENAQVLLERNAKYNCRMNYCDPTAIEERNELISAGVKNVVGDKTTRNIGIDRMVALLKTDKLQIFSTVKGLPEELERYHLKDPTKDGEYKEMPVKVDDHSIDACRYVIVATGYGDCQVQKMKTDGGWTYAEWLKSQKQAAEMMKKFKGFGVDTKYIPIKKTHT